MFRETKIGNEPNNFNSLNQKGPATVLTIQKIIHRNIADQEHFYILKWYDQ